MSSESDLDTESSSSDVSSDEVSDASEFDAVAATPLPKITDESKEPSVSITRPQLPAETSTENEKDNVGKQWLKWSHSVSDRLNQNRNISDTSWSTLVNCFDKQEAFNNTIVQLLIRPLPKKPELTKLIATATTQKDEISEFYEFK